MGVATAGLIIAGVSAAASAYGQHKAGKKQEKAQDQALTYAKEQESEQRRQFDIQEAGRKHAADVEMQQAKFMYDEQQKQLAPYRAARGAVLGRYGIAAAPAPREMPVWEGAPAATAGPGSKLPTTSSGGGGAGWMALGAGIGGLGGVAAQYLAGRQAKAHTYGAGPGVGYAPMSPFLPGTPGGPQGPPAFSPVFDAPPVTGLESLQAYQQYGVPPVDPGTPYSD